MWKWNAVKSETLMTTHMIHPILHVRRCQKTTITLTESPTKSRGLAQIPSIWIPWICTIIRLRNNYHKTNKIIKIIRLTTNGTQTAVRVALRRREINNRHHHGSYGNRKHQPYGQDMDMMAVTLILIIIFGGYPQKMNDTHMTNANNGYWSVIWAP